MIRSYLIGGLILALAALAGTKSWRLHAAQLEIAGMQLHASEQATASATAQTIAEQVARSIERAQSAAVAAVASGYQRGLSDAQENADRLVADLRAGNVQLRAQWRGCEADRVPATAAPTGGADAAEQGRRDSAGRIVRAADACDAQVSALQALVLAARAQRAVSP